MTNRSQKSGQRTAICHFSFVICHWSFAKSLSSAVVRKNVAPDASRQTVLLTQKELSRLTCRRDAGATILSHDRRLRGEIFGVWPRSSAFICGFIFVGPDEQAEGERTHGDFSFSIRFQHQ